jgi:hypothetical protein
MLDCSRMWGYPDSVMQNGAPRRRNRRTHISSSGTRRHEAEPPHVGHLPL